MCYCTVFEQWGFRVVCFVSTRSGNPLDKANATHSQGGRSCFGDINVCLYLMVSCFHASIILSRDLLQPLPTTGSKSETREQSDAMHPFYKYRPIELVEGAHDRSPRAGILVGNIDEVNSSNIRGDRA